MNIFNRIQLKSIQAKIAVGIGLYLIVTATILVGYVAITLRNMAIQAAHDQVVAQAESEAGVVDAQIEVALDTARALAQAFAAVKSQNANMTRDQVNAILEQVLVDNPDFVATYTFWKPDAFDGKDNQYANTPGHDATGQFIPYWSRGEKGGIQLEPLVGVHPGGDYYPIIQRMEKTRQEVILEPYVYPIQGKDTLITSLIVPIMAGRQYYGFAGVDIRLDFLQKLADEVDIYDKSGQLALISHGGLLAGVTGRAELAGKPATELAHFEELPIIQKGLRSAKYRGNRLEVFVPINFGETGTPWSVNISVPTAKITATANASLFSMVGINALLLVGALALLWFVSGQIARPIRQITQAAQAMAEGNLDVRAAVTSADETGVLAGAFNQMAARQQETLKAIQEHSIELEQQSVRLKERTRELEASQRVTFAASEHVSPDELLDLVVNLIRDQFNLYHAQVYIVDKQQQAAVLRQSTGYAGRQLLQKGHKIPLDRPALVTKAINTGQPVLVDDTAQTPDFMPNPLLPDTRSELVVPLKVGDKVIGALDAQDRTPGRFSASTIALFQTMTDQVAFLFENNALIEQVTERSKALMLFTNQLRTAADIARRLGAVLDPDQLLDQLVSLLQSRFGLYHAHIYTIDREANTLVVRAGSGEVGRVLRERGHNIPLDAEKSLVARAARERQAIVVDDTSLVSDFMPNPLLPQTRSELAVPLVFGDQVIGVLDVQDDQAHRFTQADVDTFGTLAGLVATALQNADLFEAQKQAEQALKQQEEKFRIVADFTYDWEYWRGADGKYVYVSPSCERITGYSASEFMQDPNLFQAIAHPDDQDILTEHLRKFHGQHRQDVGEAEFRIITRDGQERWIGHVCQPVHNAQGDWLGRRASNRDITEQKQAQAALQESVAVFTGFSQASNYGFGIADLEGNIILVNPALLRMLGEERVEDVQKKRFVSYYPEDKRRVLTEETMPTIMAGRVWTGELALQSVDGRLTPTEESFFTIPDAKGKPRYIADIITDITERKQAEQALKQQEENFRTVADFTYDWEYWRGADGKYVYVSPSCERITGYSASEFMQDPNLFQAIAHPDDQDILTEHLRKLHGQPGQDVGEAEFRIITRDGQERWIGHVCQPVHNAQGDWLGRRASNRDITEQKKAQETLRENAERLNLAMEAANAGVWEFWPQDDKAFFNDRWFTMLGYEPGELEHSYATWRSLLHPDDVERAEGVVFPAVQAGGDFVIDFRMRAKDGSWRWIHAIGKTIAKTPDGAARRMLGTHTDITTEKLAAQERERFTLQLSIAASIATQIGTILEPDQLLNTVITLLKEKFNLYHVHFYALDQAAGQLNLRAGYGEPGRLMLETGHSIPLDREQSLVARAARTRQPVVVQDVTQAPDFMPNPLLPATQSEVAVPALVGGKVLGVFDVQHDQPNYFTQGDVDVFQTLAGQIAIALQNADLFEQTQARLRVNQALLGAQTEEQVLDAMIRVANLYPGAMVSVLTFDPDSPTPTLVTRRTDAFDSGLQIKAQPNQRYEASQFLLMQHLSPDQLFVSPNLLKDERADAATRAMAQYMGITATAALPLTAGGEWMGIITATSKHENYFDKRKLYLYQALAEQSAIALRTARLYDETQKVAERLREVDRLKSEFLANMSHELRTPLNSIIGYAELMLMNLSGQLDERTLNDAQAIMDNGQHLLHMINDILDMAKIEAGRLTLNMDTVELAPLLEELATTNAGLLVNKPIELSLDIAGNLPTITADRVRLTQIVNNLLSNAIKFTERGRVTLRAYRQNEHVCIEVQDTGVGIAEQNLGVIFERFRQVDGSNARRAEGTGLGLSITSHLVRMHGGTIDVKSKLGEGSIFTVRLPIQVP